MIPAEGGWLRRKFGACEHKDVGCSGFVIAASRNLVLLSNALEPGGLLRRGAKTDCGDVRSNSEQPIAELPIRQNLAVLDRGIPRH
jgi:hypothetical protein